MISNCAALGCSGCARLLDRTRVERLTIIRSDLLDGARGGYATIMNEFERRVTRAYFAVVLGN